MKIVCAWCQKAMGDKEPITDLSHTHGICPECLRVLEQENQAK
jgi:hypothetical protein